MAKGARNKKRQKAARIRREKFAPREAARIAEIAPNLEEIRARLAEQKALDLENEKLKKMEQENNNGMDDENSKKVDPNSFDPVTKKDKDGNYAPWLTGREKKRLQKANNTIKNKGKNNKKKAQKKLTRAMNTEAGRKAIQDAKQNALDAMMKE